MNIVIFGLSITSSWANGHASTYRALLRALSRRGHRLHFFERDESCLAAHRDMAEPDFCKLTLYRRLEELKRFGAVVAEADCVIVGSSVPEGVAVGQWVFKTARGATAFYDLDTPVTLAKLARGDHEYLCPALIERFDCYLSSTGGPMLRFIEQEYGVAHARAFHCSVDPAFYYPEAVSGKWELGYLGTYSADRQRWVEGRLLEVARQMPGRRFVVAGPQYPGEIRWPLNLDRIEHLSAVGHRRFYNEQRFTLNVTRAEMMRAGWSPSVRLFEAAACGVPIISDAWEGLESFFKPGSEILVASSTRDVRAILCDLSETERREIAARARQRVLGAHTAAQRAGELEHIVHFTRAQGCAGAYSRPGDGAHCGAWKVC